MRHRTFLLALLVLACAALSVLAPPAVAQGSSPAPVQASEAEGAISNYRLGSGDVITIQVLGEDDLKRDRIRLSDAATISYPILGEIRLYGKTVGELEALIRDGLKDRVNGMRNERDRLHHQITYLEGAIEDLDYFKNLANS